MLKGHLPRVICHRVYSNIRRLSAPVGAGVPPIRILPQKPLDHRMITRQICTQIRSVCVCERERERDSGGVSVCVCERERERDSEGVSVCVCERER